MYSSRLFGEGGMIYWTDKANAENIWTMCKSYFKDFYVKQKRYNKEMGDSDSKARRK